MPIDPTNPVVALCAAGMVCDGAPGEARHLFEQAWSARRDDYDAAIAAHYLAREQPTPLLTLDWNMRAVEHCERVTDDRAVELLPSLYLNLADSLLQVRRWEEARLIAERAAESLPRLPAGGYRTLIAQGIARLQEKLAGSTAEESGSERLAFHRAPSPLATQRLDCPDASPQRIQLAVAEAFEAGDGQQERQIARSHVPS